MSSRATAGVKGETWKKNNVEKEMTGRSPNTVDRGLMMDFHNKRLHKAGVSAWLVGAQERGCKSFPVG